MTDRIVRGPDRSTTIRGDDTHGPSLRSTLDFFPTDGPIVDRSA